MPDTLIPNPDCVTKDPQSVKFGRLRVNASAIARETKLSPGYVSRILSGKRSPNALVCKAISRCLGMCVDEFITIIERKQAQS